jgi:hypothetical protein
MLLSGVTLHPVYFNTLCVYLCWLARTGRSDPLTAAARPRTGGKRKARQTPRRECDCQSATSTAASGQLGAGGVFQVHRLCALSNTALLHVAASRSSQVARFPPSCSPQPQCGEPCPKCQAPNLVRETMGWSGSFPSSSTPRHHVVIRSYYPNFFGSLLGIDARKLE